MTSKNNESEQNISEEIIEVQPIDEENETPQKSSRSRLLTGLLLFTFILASSGLIANYYLFKKLQNLSIVNDDSTPSEQLDSLNQSIQSNSGNITKLETQIEQIKQSTQDHISTLQQLQRKISELTMQSTNTATSTPEIIPKNNASSGTDIQTSLDSLKKQLLQELQSNVSSLSSNFNEQLEGLTPVQKDLEQSLIQLKKQLNQRLQQGQQQLKQKILQLEQQIQQLLKNKPQQLPPADLYFAKTQLQLIKQNLNHAFRPQTLQSSLEQLEKTLEKNTNAPKWKESLANIYSLIPQHSQAQIIDADNKLSQLQQLIPELELKSSAHELVAENKQQHSSQQRFMQELSSLIKVRYQDKKTEAVMSPQLLYFARQMMQLKLYAAKLALNEQNMPLYQTQLDDMLLIMQDYINIEQVKASSVYNQLKYLQKNLPLKIDLQTLKTQLSMLESALSDTIEQQMH